MRHPPGVFSGICQVSIVTLCDLLACVDCSTCDLCLLSCGHGDVQAAEEADDLQLAEAAEDGTTEEAEESQVLRLVVWWGAQDSLDSQAGDGVSGRLRCCLTAEPRLPEPLLGVLADMAGILEHSLPHEHLIYKAIMGVNLAQRACRAQDIMNDAFVKHITALQSSRGVGHNVGIVAMMNCVINNLKNKRIYMIESTMSTIPCYRVSQKRQRARRQLLCRDQDVTSQLGYRLTCCEQMRARRRCSWTLSASACRLP